MSRLIMSRWQQKEKNTFPGMVRMTKDLITLTLCESYNGTILPFLLIYKGKAARSLSNADFPDEFSLLHNEKQ